MAIAAPTARTRERSGPWSERTGNSDASPSCEVSTGKPPDCSVLTFLALHLRREMLRAQLHAPLLEVAERPGMQRQADVVDVHRNSLPGCRVHRHEELDVGEDRLHQLVHEVCGGI